MRDYGLDGEKGRKLQLKLHNDKKYALISCRNITLYHNKSVCDIVFIASEATANRIPEGNSERRDCGGKEMDTSMSLSGRCVKGGREKRAAAANRKQSREVKGEADYCSSTFLL